MKALFESRFPFVKLEDEKLTSEQLVIKREYEKNYFVTTSEIDKIMDQGKPKKK